MHQRKLKFGRQKEITDGRRHSSTLMELWQSVVLACLLTVLTSGIYCCGLTSFAIYNSSMYKNSFGCLTFYKCTVSVVLLLIILCWTIPCFLCRVLFKNALDIHQKRPNNVAGLICVLCSLLLHLQHL
ncbi:hypothetical protein Q1695_004772 [Nippostrongylus brasiliensis]|nr:hypothetical protein Q1695_004772 [Nippostrongylus brasiliensis]